MIFKKPGGVSIFDDQTIFLPTEFAEVGLFQSVIWLFSVATCRPDALQNASP